MNHDRQLYEQAHCRQLGNHCSMNDEQGGCYVCESAHRESLGVYTFTWFRGFDVLKQSSGMRVEGIMILEVISRKHNLSWAQ